MIYFVHLHVIKLRAKQFCIQHMLLRYIFEFLLIANIFRLIDEQRSIFDKIMQAVNSEKGEVFLLHDYGGTGKTLMWITLSSALDSIFFVLTVTSSGIASLLFPSGRTIQSKFKISVPTLENSTCNIEKKIEHSELL